jgi:hypothetical protein
MIVRITRYDNLRYKIWNEFDHQIWNQVYVQVINPSYDQILHQILYLVRDQVQIEILSPILVNQSK